MAGKVAVSRYTGNVALEHMERYGMNLVMLPYFGQDGGMDGFVRGRHIVRKDWLEYFKAGRSLMEPTSYVQITEN